MKQKLKKVCDAFIYYATITLVTIVILSVLVLLFYLDKVRF